MSKTILVTGATDGIGWTTAKQLVELGHRVLLHGRSDPKLAAAKSTLLQEYPGAKLETYRADLSILAEVVALSDEITRQHQTLDVLINNAGVFKVPKTLTADGLDVRFAVNTIAPYLLTLRLQPLLGHSGRVVNLSSAAQAPVIPDDLAKPSAQPDNAVYAQSKLALTMWSCFLADQWTAGPVVVAVNPGSLLASKMVKEAYGIAGGSLQKGASILVRAALSEEFATASGLYFDNDSGQFAQPHRDASDPQKNAAVTAAIEQVLASRL